MDRRAYILTGLVLLAVGVLVYFLFFRKEGNGEEPPPPPPGMANLYGKVRDESNSQPLPGVLVSIVEANRSTQTDSVGNYVIDEVDPGEYAVKFEKEGYVTVTK